jgi:hypothetical protein
MSNKMAVEPIKKITNCKQICKTFLLTGACSSAVEALALPGSRSKITLVDY